MCDNAFELQERSSEIPWGKPVPFCLGDRSAV
jgi:hypothetical protein